MVSTNGMDEVTTVKFRCSCRESRSVVRFNPRQHEREYLETKTQTYTYQAACHFVGRFLDGMSAEDEISCDYGNYKIFRNGGKLSFLCMA